MEFVYNYSVIFKYADIIDGTFGSNYVQQLEQYLENMIRKKKIKRTEDVFKNSKLYKKLRKSYNKMLGECERTYVDFMKMEQEKREKFYEAQTYKENLKVEPEQTERDTEQTPERVDGVETVKPNQDIYIEQDGEEQGG